jgi:hypothetical protein
VKQKDEHKSGEQIVYGFDEYDDAGVADTKLCVRARSRSV